MSNVVHNPEYIAWVKRSLNRLVFAGLKTDGQVTLLYRLWVREFQYRTGCRLGGNGSVDKKTQDYLIAINNVSTNQSSRIYIAWVQQALLKLNMGSGFAANGELTKETKNAIKKFQLSVKHKHIDGVVGPKTEIDLAKIVTDLRVPGYYPGGPQRSPLPHPNGDWKDNAIDPRNIDQLMESWINLLLTEIREEPLSTYLDPKARKAIQGMLPILQAHCNKYRDPYYYEFLTAQAARAYSRGEHLNEPVTKYTKNAYKELWEALQYLPNWGPSSRRYAMFKEAVYNLYETIDNGVRQIIADVSNGSGVNEGSYAHLSDWYEAHYEDKDTIISCLPSPRGKPHHPF
ncbi:MAG: peptidoglycan-binding domain-containing protein [Pyrinomonadaceae bacterium]